MGRRDYESAIKTLSHALDKESLAGGRSILLVHRGTAYWINGDTENALTDCSSIIDLKRLLPRGYLLRGLVYSEAGNYERAMSDYDSAEKFGSSLADVYFARGETYSSQHKYEQAIAEYTKGIAIETRRADIYLARGQERTTPQSSS